MILRIRIEIIYMYVRHHTQYGLHNDRSKGLIHSSIAMEQLRRDYLQRDVNRQNIIKQSTMVRSSIVSFDGR